MEQAIQAWMEACEGTTAADPTNADYRRWQPGLLRGEIELYETGGRTEAPKCMFGGTDLTQLYYNSTLPLDGDTGEIVWPYQHLNDLTGISPSKRANRKTLWSEMRVYY